MLPLKCIFHPNGRKITFIAISGAVKPQISIDPRRCQDRVPAEIAQPFVEDCFLLSC
jgi:hypothetical protein